MGSIGVGCGVVGAFGSLGVLVLLAMADVTLESGRRLLERAARGARWARAAVADTHQPPLVDPE